MTSIFNLNHYTKKLGEKPPSIVTGRTCKADTPVVRKMRTGYADIPRNTRLRVRGGYLKSV